MQGTRRRRRCVSLLLSYFSPIYVLALFSRKSPVNTRNDLLVVLARLPPKRGTEETVKRTSHLFVYPLRSFMISLFLSIWIAELWSPWYFIFMYVVMRWYVFFIFILYYVYVEKNNNLLIFLLYLEKQSRNVFRDCFSENSRVRHRGSSNCWL